MFTGIVQSIAKIVNVSDKNGIRTFIIDFKVGFCNDLEVGASVAVDGVCLTVTELISEVRVKFDIMLQSLLITALSEYENDSDVNVERAAKDGAEIGGHPLSGHVDFNTPIEKIVQIEDNYCIRLSLSNDWKRYIFPKGYIALNGASLTVSQVNKQENWFEVWLIPETRRMTVFEDKIVGDNINVEIERGTQVVVDTVRDTLHESLGPLLPLFEKLLMEQGIDVNSLGHSSELPVSKSN
ncbi:MULTISPECIES: riboflavin synthase subunit alpha [unclassified Colwellia]|uniref:riboflavin synthase subunit alpha n=1 Tax=unclassified Colwellia TaxID=196834 RepID=UPI0015F603D2|nr:MULTISPECIES: riboflavin synthase subunit alpha [unclassified Colwellia]MBA6232962.1 riboflavin synthase subunit alpha [Colwellia sp. MB02u-7]MBA6237095.1 riboflavin synthase subunit alpha [Colwellia sp. MB02u-11]MBA6258118.1 riboflavin synthase subunit alpha [Colwellia sp. MB3u-28]MBA6259546.1 riboflavin synthase subunit alpha [Colwellia sp. MB3u-41]MBA6299425.1 riboflavin synthase subunit alpha [Colwellia sp. MB3u-22]